MKPSLASKAIFPPAQTAAYVATIATETAVEALWKALRTLDPGQGPRGRRNARQRVAKALKEIQAAVDHHYPAPARKAPKRVKRRSVLERRKALVTDGFVIVSGTVLAELASVRVPIIRTPQFPLDHKVASAAGLNYEHPPVARAAALKLGVDKVLVKAASWAPGWAVHYYVSGQKSLISTARHNSTMIQAAKAAIRLGSIAQARNGDIQCPAT